MNLALTKSLGEIEQPVIKRVIPIALRTTQKLILKDFALVADPVRMKKAMHMTSKSLATQLSQITCTEPLRDHFSNFINIHLQQHLGEKVIE